MYQIIFSFLVVALNLMFVQNVAAYGENSDDDKDSKKVMNMGESMYINSGMYRFEMDKNGRLMMVTEKSKDESGMSDDGMEQGQKFFIPRNKPISASCMEAGGTWIPRTTVRQGPLSITPKQFSHTGWVSTGARFGVSHRKVTRYYESSGAAVVSTSKASSDVFPPFKGSKYTINPYVSGTLRTARGARVTISANHKIQNARSWSNGGCFEIQYSPGDIHEDQ